MLNKKGFTIAEVVVSFSLVSVILASMVGTTVYYRDKMKQEEIITQLVDFKNTIVNTIYDDILSDTNRRIVKVERCADLLNCVNFIDRENNVHTLAIKEYASTDSYHKKGVYLNYDDKFYMLPDSDLGDSQNRVCDFIEGFNLDHYTEGEFDLYTVKTSFRHRNLDKNYSIMVTLTHYDENA